MWVDNRLGYHLLFSFMTPSYGIAHELSEQIYQFISEKKTLPWRQWWISRAFNPITETRYKGINHFMALISMERYKLTIPQFLTYKQIHELWGAVKQGEKSIPIIFFKTYARSFKDVDIDIKNELASENSECTLGHKSLDEKHRPGYFLRYYRVFWVEQTKLPMECYYHAGVPQTEAIDHEKLLATIRAYCERENIRIEYKWLRAFYDLNNDSIQIPRRENFTRISDFYFTLLHEIAHSTGNKQRLMRFSESIRSGSSREEYAFEEVVADMSACLMMSRAWLSPDLPNSASYVDGWLTYWEDKKDQIYKASRIAQKVSEFVFNDLPWWNNIVKKDE